MSPQLVSSASVTAQSVVELIRLIEIHGGVITVTMPDGRTIRVTIADSAPVP